MRAHRVLVSIILIAVVGVLASGAPGAITISQVVLVNHKYYLNGTDQNDYSYDLGVEGTGITSVTVAGPDSTSFTLTQEDVDAWYSESSFGSLTALRTAFPIGDYVFNFNGGAASLTVNFAGTAPGSFPVGINPLHGATGVSTTPKFTWSLVPVADGIALTVDVRDIAADDTVTESSPLNMGDTQWTCPVTLDPGTLYEVEVYVVRGSVSGGTIDSTSFDIYSVYLYGNAVDFTTTPEPATMALLGLGGAALMARWKRRK